MILGDIRHFDKEKYTFPPAVFRGLEIIVSRQLSRLEPGRYEIDGELMFALVQEYVTKPVNEKRFESHSIYMDIQLLVSGTEKIQWLRHSADLIVTEDLMEERDIVFYKHPENGDASDLILNSDQFVVFYPWDVHRPSCTATKQEAIKKVVLKVHRQLWEALV